MPKNNKETAEALDAAPVAEVVLCEECIHRRDCFPRVAHYNDNPVHDGDLYIFHPITFCSKGERRE